MANVFITFVMMLLIILFIVKFNASPSLVMVAIPLIAALCMGFSLPEVATFIDTGVQRIAGTLFLMLFGIAYFGILHEAGVFNALVKVILRRLKNSVFGVLFATALITFLTQLDGSGTTTALCTIPPMRPIYERMRIRREALVLVESLGSAVLTLIPWAPGICEASAYAGVDVYEVCRWLFPLFIFSIILVFVFCVGIGIVKKRAGAGIDKAEFQEIITEIQASAAEYPFGKAKAIFDGIVTAIVMAAVLSGIMKPVLAFALGYVLLAVVNFRTPKAQKDYLTRQAPTMINLTFVMLGVGTLIGVLNGIGTINTCAMWVSQQQFSFVAYLPVLACLLSIPMSIVLSSNAKAGIIVPAMIAMCEPLGYSSIQIVGAVFATGVIAANINFFSATPYLSLSLAGVEMRDNLKYCFVPIYLFSVLMTAFLVISGMLPIM